MSDVVLVTETEYAKAQATFLDESRFRVQTAPDEEQALARAVRDAAARAVIVGVESYAGPLYQSLGESGGPSGAIIARFGVGHDGIDKRLAREGNIMVTNTPGVLDQSVAEHVFWLLGSLARHVPHLSTGMREGRFAPQTGMEVSGKTLGIVGFGAIGRRVAATAHRALQMRVLAVGSRDVEQLAQAEEKSLEAIKARYGLGEYTTDVEAVLREADVVSLHLPANEATRRFMNAQRLAMLKPGALLINTARGSIVDEKALYEALTAGPLAAAALDVFEKEPYEPAAPEKDLRTLDNVILTPHVGSNTREANRRMAQASLDNVAAFLAGQFAGLSRVDGGD